MCPQISPPCFSAYDSLIFKKGYSSLQVHYHLYYTLPPWYQWGGVPWPSQGKNGACCRSQVLSSHSYIFQRRQNVQETLAATLAGRFFSQHIFLSLSATLSHHPPSAVAFLSRFSNCLYSNWIIFSYILRWQNSSCSSEMFKCTRTGPSSENVCISRTRDHVHLFLPLFLKRSFTSRDWITSWTDPEGPTRTHW